MTGPVSPLAAVAAVTLALSVSAAGAQTPSPHHDAPAAAPSPRPAERAPAGRLPPPAVDAPDESILIRILREEAVAYEHGENGLPQDGALAAANYCKAARLGDAESQFALGWMYANGRGIERNDSLAAFFFQAAAEQGLEQAARMLQTVGGPTTEVPDCLHEPASAATLVAAVKRHVPREALIGAPKTIVDLVNRIAPEYRVEPALALAIIRAESNFDTVALSPKNAKGLMQLLPETAARFGVRSIYDPAQNIRGGIAYLRWLLSYFEGDVSLVAAAYNAGEGTVDRYRGIPPYLETRIYVRRILEVVGEIEHPFDAGVTAPSPVLRLIKAPRRAG